MNYISIIEGLLFLCGDEGLNIVTLASTLEIDEIDVKNYLDELYYYYKDNDDRGIELVKFGDVYKFVSKANIHEHAAKLFANTKIATLSQSALETLAIIAYKQPITRVEIEDIRGVGCDNMIRKLQARGLIMEVGRSDAPGKPFLYEITQEFMDAFNLSSLSELPDLPEFALDEEQELFADENIDN